MKPMIIIVNSNNDGKIILSESQLNEIIDMAYNDGYSDGYRIYYPQYIPLTNPYITTTTTTSTSSTFGDEYENYPNITVNSTFENNKVEQTNELN